MSPKMNRQSLGFLSILKLGYFCLILANLVYAGPVPEVRPELSSSGPNPKPSLRSPSNPPGKENSLAQGKTVPDLPGPGWRVGWRIGKDHKGNVIFGFGTSRDELPSGIVTVGEKLNDEESGGSMFKASMLTFKEARHVGEDFKSSNWGGKKSKGDEFQPDVVARFNARQGASIMEKLKRPKGARSITPDVYKRLQITSPRDERLTDSMIVMGRLDKSLSTLLKSSTSQKFDSLIMLQQWSEALAEAHRLGIANQAVSEKNYMKTSKPDAWRISNWFQAVDYAQKPGMDRDRKQAFAHDIQNLGGIIFKLALPPALRAFHSLPDNLDKESSDAAKAKLQAAFDFKEHQGFLRILHRSLCKNPMTMKELNFELHRMPGNKIPLLQPRIPDECSSSILSKIRCYIKKVIRIIKSDAPRLQHT